MILLLPVAAAALLAWQFHRSGCLRLRRAATGTVIGNASAVTNGPGPVSYRYISGGPLPMAAAFVADASRACDSSIGDGSTGYCATNTGDPYTPIDLYVMVDIGSPRAISQWRYSGLFKGGHYNSVTLYGMNVLTSRSWTPIDVTYWMQNGPNAANRQIVPATYRYWMVRYGTVGPGASVTGTDVRLYDANKSLIVVAKMPVRRCHRRIVCRRAGP